MAAIAAFVGIISAVCLFVPIGAIAQDDLKIGKYRITADFPCRPKRNKQFIGRSETGDEISEITLDCTQGGVTYSLSVTEFFGQMLKALQVLSTDAWIKGMLDGARSRLHYALKSSSRVSYQNFPAFRMHALDSSVPPFNITRLFVMTDAGLVWIGASWPLGSPEPPRATSFTSSLGIGKE